MSGVAALAFAAAFTSCSKSTGLYDEGAVKEKQEQENQEKVTNSYETAFINAFGKPASDQDWGFASRQLPASFGAKTRGAYPNGNMWESDGYTVPGDITKTEREAVLAVFNQPGEASYTSLIDWNDFFVQQVFKGTAKYYAHNQYNNNNVADGLKDNATSFTGSDKMNWLCTVAEQKEVTTCWWPLATEIQSCDPYDDHIFDFNDANSDDYGGRMLMLNSNTKTFGYYNSEDSKVHYNFRMEKINGNYYVGFDFYGDGDGGPNMKIDRDFIYNDWIVKIVPATGVTPPTRYTVRIICEDLMANASSDFDFNDVVFDASYKEGDSHTYITVKAAGGTIPLYIEGKEVHKLFQEQYPDAGIILPADGVKGTMINTHATGGVEVGDATLVLNSIKAPWDIAITINNGGTTIPLKAEVGQPAAKIAVDPSFLWLNERDDIRKVCPNFPSYVQDTTVNWY